jgi:hypothetical protein
MISHQLPIFVHRESILLQFFQLKKNLSKTLIANSMEDYIKNKATLSLMSIQFIKELMSILKLKSIILLIIHKKSML